MSPNDLNNGKLHNIPLWRALDMSPDFGFTMRGWDFSSDTIQAAIRDRLMLNPAIELAPNICPWNCSFCSTESVQSENNRKRRHKNELSTEAKLSLIDQCAKLGARSINIVGAGEPTVDPHLWAYLEKMQEYGITPIIYTEASTRLCQRKFAQKLFDYNATIVVKVNSLVNAEYQDALVRGTTPKPGTPSGSYLEKRNEAIQVLLDIGFANESPTRLAFDTIICKQNIEEIEDIHNYARLHNIFVLFVNFLPSGRTLHGHADEINLPQQQEIFSRLAVIDRQRYGINRETMFPYSGGVPCSIRGLGLLITDQGEVFDCPGKSVLLGNVNTDSLSTLWDSASSITKSFDGQCLPRAQFWEEHQKHILDEKMLR